MNAVLQVASEPPPLPGGYGWALLQSALALAAVCILAWVALRWGARRGFGVPMSGKRVRVMERVALDARRSLHLVEIGPRVLLIGVGGEGSPCLITESARADLPEAVDPPVTGFADVLRKLRQRGDG